MTLSVIIESTQLGVCAEVVLPRRGRVYVSFVRNESGVCSRCGDDECWESSVDFRDYIWTRQNIFCGGAGIVIDEHLTKEKAYDIVKSSSELLNIIKRGVLAMSALDDMMEREYY